MRPAAPASLAVALDADISTCSPSRLTEDAMGFTLFRASSSGFSCPLLSRAGCSREPFWIPYTGPGPPSEARLGRKRTHRGPVRSVHTAFGLGSLLRSSGAIGDKGMVSWWIAGQAVFPECAPLPPFDYKDLGSPSGLGEGALQASGCRLKFWVSL